MLQWVRLPNNQLQASRGVKRETGWPQARAELRSQYYESRDDRSIMSEAPCWLVLRFRVSGGV
jgi:hypothetical protein